MNPLILYDLLLLYYHLFYHFIRIWSRGEFFFTSQMGMLDHAPIYTDRSTYRFTPDIFL